MLVGVRIKELRKKKGLTQENLAKMINVDKSTISGYESGTKRPSIETLQLLADALDVSADYLLGNDHYEIASDDTQYGTAFSKEEVELINEFRRYPRLHEKIIEDPKRFVELVNMKLK